MRTVSSTTHAEYERLAEQLALMPDVIAKLVTDHVADSTGCLGCTRGGTGHPHVSRPCALHRLALMALSVRKRTRRQPHAQTNAPV
jgi:hypothetical protein